MSEYTAEMATKAARKGAQWMDENCEGWTLLIDLNALALESPANCVLGQTAHCITHGAVPSNDDDLYIYLDEEDEVDMAGYIGSSFEGAVEYSRRRDPRFSAVEYGFDIVMPVWGDFTDYERERDARYEMLTIAWHQEIRQRSMVAA